MKAGGEGSSVYHRNFYGRKFGLGYGQGTLCLRDDGGCGVEAWTDVQYGDDEVFG